MALYTGSLRPKMVPFSGFGYIGTHTTDSRLIYNVYNGQFRLSQRKFHFFFWLKLTCLIQTRVNTDNAHFSLSRVTLPYTCIVNPAFWTLAGYLL